MDKKNEAGAGDGPGLKRLAKPKSLFVTGIDEGECGDDIAGCRSVSETNEELGVVVDAVRPVVDIVVAAAAVVSKWDGGGSYRNRLP